MDGFLPLDVSRFTEAEQKNARGMKLPSKPPKREKWESAKAAALEDQNNLEKWNSLFKALEEKYEQSKDSKSEIEPAVTHSFSLLLHRFPYMSDYWKRYLILQYKVSGINESLKVLETAVEKYPQSVSLWVDYLNASLAVYEQEKEDSTAKETAKDDDSSDKEKLDDLRQIFVLASKAIGLNFNSDTFWNLYIDFETKYASPDDKRLLNLYLRLISIPLYQYARYYNQFSEISKSFSVVDILPEEALKGYLDQFQKALVDELSTVEQHQIIDTYVYNVFSNTQKKVNEKWSYESALTFPEFSPTDLDAILAQTESWKQYLDYECGILDSSKEDPEQCALVVSVFERALVPNCFDASIWQRYADFLEKHPATNFKTDQIIPDVQSVYERAILQFVPLKETDIREKYVQYLMRNEKFDKANEFLLSLIRLYSGSSGAYVKNAYIHSVRELLRLWNESLLESHLADILEPLVDGYFDRIDRYKKPAASETENKVDESKFAFKASFSTALSKSLNADGVCIVAVAYLQTLAKDTKSATKIRTFYNKFYRNSAFSHSVQFWKFFVEYEGYTHKNLVNLRAVVNHIKSATSLPKRAVDYFIDIYYEITCANLAMATALRQNDDYLDILITRDNEKSETLKANLSARQRLANNNHMIQEYEELSKGGFHLPNGKQDLLMSMRLRQLGHPGIFVDTKPEITNRIVDSGWTSLLDDKPIIPPLPNARFVDKASAPINYPDE